MPLTRCTALVACMLAVHAAAGQTPAKKSLTLPPEIAAVNDRMMQACSKGDAIGFSAGWARDAVLYASNAQPQRGLQDIRIIITDYFTRAEVESCTTEISDVRDFESGVVEIGVLIIVRRNPGATAAPFVPTTSRYFRVWERTPAGSWAITLFANQLVAGAAPGPFHFAIANTAAVREAALRNKPPTPAQPPEVADVARAMMKACGTGDWNGYMSRWAPEAVQYNNNSAPKYGGTAIRGFFADYFSRNDMQRCTQEVLEVRAFNGGVVEMGIQAMTRKPPNTDASATSHLRYFMIWEKTPSGAWLVSRFATQVLPPE